MTDRLDGKNKANALTALASAALALPGISGNVQAAPLSSPTLEYKASHYREDDIEDDKLAGSEGERYRIDTHQLRYSTPLSRVTDLSVDLMVESFSGASPWYVQPDPDGEPIVVMSGASIEESRVDVQAAGSYHFAGNHEVNVALGASKEDDYQSVNVSVGGARQFYNEQITLSGGVGYSDDELSPHEAGPLYPKRASEGEKDSVTAFGGVSVVLNPLTMVQGSLSFNRQSGFLSDPYKEAWIVSAANTVADSRPDSRVAWALSMKLRHFLKRIKAAVHADYRYFDDDWDVQSHTLELGWLQNLPQDWRLETSVRWYSQTGAYFYAPYYFTPRSDGLASSDYRLSPFGAISFRLAAVKSIGDWELNVQYEWYQADKSYALETVSVENPALVEFDSISIGLKHTF